MRMRRIVLDALRENRGRTAALLALVLGSVAAGLVPPQLLRLLVDRNLNAGTADGLGALAGCYLAALALAGALDFGKGWVLTRLGQRVVRATRSRMMEKAGRVPLRYFTEHATGAVAARFTTDAESLNTLFADGLVSMAADCLRILGILASIAAFSSGLAAVTLALVPLVLLVTRAFQRRMLRAQTANLEQLGLVSSHVSESLKNVQMIKLFHKEQYMEEAFCRRLEDNYRTKQRVNRFDSCYAPVIQLLRALAIAAVVVLSSPRLHLLGITVGMLAASIELLSSLLAPVEALGMELQSIQQGLSGIRRVDAFLSLPEDEKDETLTAEAVAGPRREVRVAFQGVTFAYEAGQEVLRDVSFTAEPRTRVALAGRTGVGKSTLMRLVLGLLAPEEGEVWINEAPARRIPDREKRRIFGYVEQQFQFVTGTALDQITLGDGRITAAQAEEACRFVGLHDTIARLPEGYGTVLRDGSAFSFGQRQLLSIARAIVTDPPVLLLDEMTANLDSATEERLLEVLDRACAHRTILSISHRSATLLRCDKLVRIEHGRVAGQGPPDGEA